MLASQTRKQTFEKKEQALTSDQTVRARNHPNPIHKYKFLSEPFPALAALRNIFLLPFYHFRPYYIYNFHVYLCPPSSIIE